MIWKLLWEVTIAIFFCNFFAVAEDVIESFRPKSDYPRELNDWLEMVQKHREDFRLIRDAVSEQSPHRKNYLKLYMDDSGIDEAPQNDIYPHMYEKQSMPQPNPSLDSKKPLRLTSNPAKNPLRLRRDSAQDRFFEKNSDIQVEPKSQSGEIKRIEMKYPERFVHLQGKNNEKINDNDNNKNKREIQIDVLNDGKLIKEIREDDRDSQSIVLNIESVDDNKHRNTNRNVPDEQQTISPNNRGPAILDAPLKLEPPSNQFKDKETLNNFKNLFSENEHLNTDATRENLIKSGLGYHVTIPNFETMHDTTSNYPPNIFEDHNIDTDDTTSNNKKFNRNGLQDMSKFWSPTEKSLLQTGIKIAQGHVNLEQMRHDAQQSKPSQDGFEVVESMVVDNGGGNKEKHRQEKKATLSRYPNKRQLSKFPITGLGDIDSTNLISMPKNSDTKLEDIEPLDVLRVSNEIPRELISDENKAATSVADDSTSTESNEIYFGSLNIQNQGLGKMSGHYVVNTNLADKGNLDNLEESISHNLDSNMAEQDTDVDQGTIIGNSLDESDLSTDSLEDSEVVVPIQLRNTPEKIEHNIAVTPHTNIKKIDQRIFGHQIVTVVETVTDIAANGVESKQYDGVLATLAGVPHYDKPAISKDDFHPHHKQDPEKMMEKDEGHEESLDNRYHKIEDNLRIEPEQELKNHHDILKTNGRANNEIEDINDINNVKDESADSNSPNDNDDNDDSEDDAQEAQNLDSSNNKIVHLIENKPQNDDMEHNKKHEMLAEPDFIQHDAPSHAEPLNSYEKVPDNDELDEYTTDTSRAEEDSEEKHLKPLNEDDESDNHEHVADAEMRNRLEEDAERKSADYESLDEGKAYTDQHIDHISSEKNSETTEKRLSHHEPISEERPIGSECSGIEMQDPNHINDKNEHCQENSECADNLLVREGISLGSSKPGRELENHRKVSSKHSQSLQHNAVAKYRENETPGDVTIIVVNENGRQKHNIYGHLHPKTNSDSQSYPRAERKSKKSWRHKKHRYKRKKQNNKMRTDAAPLKNKLNDGNLEKIDNHLRRKQQRYYNRHPDHSNKKKYRNKQYHHGIHKITENNKKLDKDDIKSMSAYIGRQLKADDDYIYDASVESPKNEAKQDDELEEQPTSEQNQAKSAIHKNSVEGDYGDEEDSISGKKRQEDLLVKHSDNELANPVATTDYDDDDYEDEVEENTHITTTTTRKTARLKDITGIDDDRSAFGKHLHKKITTKKSLSKKPGVAQKLGQSKNIPSEIDNKANAEFYHWPKFVLSDQENEEILRKRSLSTKKKHSNKENFRKSSKDFFVKQQEIQRARNNRKRSDESSTLSAEFSSTDISIKFDEKNIEDILGDTTSETTNNSDIITLSTLEMGLSTGFNSSISECTISPQNACDEENTSNRPDLETVLSIVKDAQQRESLNHSIVEEPEVFEKLDEVINGEVPKKIVDNILSELKANEVLKRKFFRGLKPKKSQMSPNATDTNNVQTKKLLYLMSRIMDKLQFTTTCQVIPNILRSYLRDTTRVNKDEAMSRAKEMNEIDLDDHQNDKSNRNFMFRSLGPGEGLEDKMRMLQELLDKYNSLPEACKPRARPVKEYIENHMGMLNSMLSVGNADIDSSKRISKDLSAKEYKKQEQIDEQPNALVEQQLESIGLGKKNNYKPKFNLDEMVQLNRLTKSIEHPKKAINKREVTGPSQSYNKLKRAVLKEKMEKSKEHKLGELYGTMNEDYFADDASDGDGRMNFESPVVFSLQ